MEQFAIKYGGDPQQLEEELPSNLLADKSSISLFNTSRDDLGRLTKTPSSKGKFRIKNKLSSYTVP